MQKTDSETPTKFEFEYELTELYIILISYPDDFGLILNVFKVWRMLTNLLGSSWSNLFTLEAALGNVLDLKYGDHVGDRDEQV